MFFSYNKESNKKRFYHKIWWRFKFLFFESWNKDWKVIICSLRSANKRASWALAKSLHKQKLIKWQCSDNFFEYCDVGFYYDTLPFIDFLDIWLFNSSYVKRNFFKNSAYHFDGPYEMREVVLSSGDYVIDAGANIGLFSIFASQKVGRKGRVYAFEPIKKAQELLFKNINSNDTKNVQIAPYALGDKNRELEFIIFDRLGASSGYYKSRKDILPRGKEKVSQITLDDFVIHKQIKRIDFIKADIEGMERNLLQGAEKIIKLFKPKISVCIYHRPDDPMVVENMLKSFVPEYKILKTDSKLYAWV